MRALQLIAGSQLILGYWSLSRHLVLMAVQHTSLIVVRESQMKLTNFPPSMHVTG